MGLENIQNFISILPSVRYQECIRRNAGSLYTSHMYAECIASIMASMVSHYSTVTWIGKHL